MSAVDRLFDLLRCFPCDPYLLHAVAERVSIVAEAYLPIASARADAPDETYMVSTYTSPWYAWPLLVAGQSYFDLAAISHPIHFEMDTSGHLLKPGLTAHV